jgi:NADH-quinone oxidoreductase subunit G
LVTYLKSLTENVTLALAPVSVVGQDDNYPKDVHGHEVLPAKFTIRAEKAPNRRGIEMILHHFAGTATPMGDILGRAASGEFGAVYCVGGDPQGWINDEQAAALEKPETVVVQDILASAATKRATVVLPGGSFAERDGTFVNHAGLAQGISRTIHGPGDARPDNRILWELAGRRGLFNLRSLRKEMGEAIPALAALASGELGPEGVRLVAAEVAAI